MRSEGQRAEYELTGGAYPERTPEGRVMRGHAARGHRAPKEQRRAWATVADAQDRKRTNPMSNDNELAKNGPQALPALARVSEVAKSVGLSVGTIYKLIADGDITAVKVRGALRVHRESVLDYFGF